jgi:hypothetical protein
MNLYFYISSTRVVPRKYKLLAPMGFEEFFIFDVFTKGYWRFKLYSLRGIIILFNLGGTTEVHSFRPMIGITMGFLYLTT